MRSLPTPADETLSLWYELGRLYAEAGEDARRSSLRGFTVVCVAAALVLLSAPLFGTSWAALTSAAAIPVVAGLLTAGGSFGYRRGQFVKRRGSLRRSLAEKGLDADRPTATGLHAYCDTQLLLLRCEYEYLRSRRTGRATRSARLFEEAFGFTPEDPFECGPLNVKPGTRQMFALRGRWEGRLAARRTFGEGTLSLGLREDSAYHVFPREMTIPSEIAVKSAYLKISCDLFRERYGRERAPEDVRLRAENDLQEYKALCRR